MDKSGFLSYNMSMINQTDTERYLVTIGHEESNACTNTAQRVLEFGKNEDVARFDIRSLGDPGLDSCGRCDKPLTRVVTFTPAHKPAK